jgi:hypothetical protein
MLDAEGRVIAGRLDIYFFDLIDVPEPWAGRQFMLERFNIMRWAFGQRLDTAVIEILHIAVHLMPRRGALREVAIAHPLHIAADEKSSRDSHNPDW